MVEILIFLVFIYLAAAAASRMVNKTGCSGSCNQGRSPCDCGRTE